MNNAHSKQVEVSHYAKTSYLTLVRTITHWYQAHEISRSCKPGSEILEIGPGCGHTGWILRLWGFKVTTLDFDPEISPDIVADITKFETKEPRFDAVIAAEVLEHLPFDQFDSCLQNIRLATKKTALITLPAPFVGISMGLNVPKLDLIRFNLGFPYKLKHKFDGQHYRELGKIGFSRRKIKYAIERSGFRIVRHYRPLLSLYSYFFVLEKK